MKRASPGWLSIVFLLIASGFCSTPALANTICSFTITDINFGDVDLVSGNAFTITGTLTATCWDGSVDKNITICPSIAEGSGGAGAGGATRYLKNGTNQLQYNLYQDAGMSQIWGSMDWAYAPQPPRWLVWKSAYSVTASRMIYARIPAGQTTLPTGLYSSAFTGGYRARIEYKEGTETCAAIHNSADGTEYASFNVTANNTATCTVAANALDFGNVGVIGTNVDATSTLSLTCNNGTPYTVGLNGGLSGATDPTQRRMSLSGNNVTYGLYRDAARTQPWGNTIGSNTLAGTGSGTAQTLTVYGRVPAQTTPAPGTYTDTIVVTVTY